jgi:uncharacterized protein YndB with AHSA1/START domain
MRAVRKASHRLLVVLACAAAAWGCSSRRPAELPATGRAASFAIARTASNEVTVERRFAAAPSAVFAALTEPAKLQRWMSAAGRELVTCDVDLRAGGTFRYVFKGPSGKPFVMYGDYREVVAPRRIVHTEAYEGYDWAPLVTTIALRDDGAGGTALAMKIRYPSEEICAEDFPNVESGFADGFTRLDTLLTSP